MFNYKQWGIAVAKTVAISAGLAALQEGASVLVEAITAAPFHASPGAQVAVYALGNAVAYLKHSPRAKF